MWVSILYIAITVDRVLEVQVVILKERADVVK